MAAAAIQIDGPPHHTTAAGSEARPSLARAAGATLAEQLAQRFAERIEQRLLAPGARLPSVRDCAERHQVSPSTVVGAYDLLQARGWWKRARSAASSCAPARRCSAPARSPGGGAGGRHGADPQHVPGARRRTVARHGHAARGLAGRRLLQRALRRASSAAAAQSWLRYGDPAGSPALRQSLSRGWPTSACRPRPSRW
jgi:DNA-binding transcriptional MocR family regulator